MFVCWQHLRFECRVVPHGRSSSNGINPLSDAWTSHAGKGPAQLDVDGDEVFGESPFLQASDYQQPARFPAVKSSYSLTST